MVVILFESSHCNIGADLGEAVEEERRFREFWLIKR